MEYKGKDHNYTKEELIDILNSQMLMGSYVTTLFVKALMDRLGDEGKAIAEKILYQQGIFVGDHLLANGYITKTDIQGYRQFIDYVTFVTDIKKEVIKMTDTEMIVKVYDCPVGMMLGSFGSAHDICHILTCTDVGVCRALGFKAEYKYTNKISVGDNCCDYYLRKIES